MPSMDRDFLTMVGNLIMTTRYELFLFTAAVAAHFLLFGHAAPKRAKASKSKDSEREDAWRASPATEATDVRQVEKAFQAAFENGDHRQVLRCWCAAKKCQEVPSIPLTQAVESMQRFKKDDAFILRELRAFFKRCSGDRGMSPVNDLLESLGKRLDSELMEKIVDLLPSVGLAMDPRSYEIFLNVYFTTRSFPEVKRCLNEMRTRKIPLTTRAAIVAIKTALKTNDLAEAIRQFRELKLLWIGSSPAVTTSLAPKHVVIQIVELACREHQLGDFMPELTDVPITEEVMNLMLNECVRQKDLCLAQEVEQLGRKQGLAFSDRKSVV